MRKPIRILLIGLLFLCLVIIRVFETELFYDPYVLFYKNHYALGTLDELNFYKLIFNTFLRYTINTAISLTILYFSFKSKDILRLSSIFYSIAFIVLIGAYTTIELTLTKDTYQLFFYVRRFLIQPIFVLILLPAFYYQRIKK
jgi:exosortase F-associated protein